MYIRSRGGMLFSGTWQLGFLDQLASLVGANGWVTIGGIICSMIVSLFHQSADAGGRKNWTIILLIAEIRLMGGKHMLEKGFCEKRNLSGTVVQSKIGTTIRRVPSLHKILTCDPHRMKTNLLLLVWMSVACSWVNSFQSVHKWGRDMYSGVLRGTFRPCQQHWCLLYGRGRRFGGNHRCWKGIKHLCLVFIQPGPNCCNASV